MQSTDTLPHSWFWFELCLWQCIILPGSKNGQLPGFHLFVRRGLFPVHALDAFIYNDNTVRQENAVKMNKSVSCSAITGEVKLKCYIFLWTVSGHTLS